jgi:hypothetical protein
MKVVMHNGATQPENAQGGWLRREPGVLRHHGPARKITAEPVLGVAVIAPATHEGRGWRPADPLRGGFGCRSSSRL